MIARPLIWLPDDAVITNVEYLSEIDVTPVRTVGYWLLFRNTIWRLNKDFTFKIYVKSAGKVFRFEIIIKAGFETDFASIPKLLWWLYSPEDCRYNKAAIGHDVMYAGELFSKWFEDDFLAAGMIDASKANQFNFHWSVKLFGWKVYREHTEESIDAARLLIDLEEFQNESVS